MDSLLNKIDSPADLRRLSRTELGALAGELRQFVLHTVSQTAPPAIPSPSHRFAR